MHFNCIYCSNEFVLIIYLGMEGMQLTQPKVEIAIALRYFID